MIRQLKTDSADYLGVLKKNVTNPVIPKSVTEIGAYTFYDNDVIVKPVLHGGIMAIRDGAFESCGNLQFDGPLPEGITSIGATAFKSCTKLNLTKLPDNLTTIGDSAFYATGNGTIGLTELPSGVTTVGNLAFYNSKVKFSSLPAGYLRLEAGVFQACPELLLSSLPEGAYFVSSYAWQVFYGCPKITISYLPNSITFIPAWQFAGCTSIQSMTGNRVSTIVGSGSDNGSFRSDTGLQWVSFGSAGYPVTAIGLYAFTGCTNLTAIDLWTTEGAALANQPWGATNPSLVVTYHTA